MKRIKSILLAIAIATTATVFLNSCQEDAPEINYTMNVSVTNDFSKVIEAINNGSLKSEAAITELVNAIDNLSGDQQTKLQTIIDALTTLNTTLETKLDLIEAVMKAQTLSLEDKLDLLKTAISNLPDYSDKLEAIEAAIEALPDYSDKLEATEAAIAELVNAIDNLSGDQQTKLQTIIDALTTLNTTLETKLDLIEAAMKAQTLSLEDKLDLLEDALNNQTIKQEELAGLLADAIDSLAEDMDEKLQDIAEVIGDVDTTIETKLSLIEAAINAQTLSLEDKLDLLKTAISNLPDYSDKLEAIKAAISALPDYSDKFDAVVAALNEIKAQAEAIATGQTGIANQIGNAVSAIEDLIAQVSSGNTDAATALAAIIQKLEELKTAIENIEAGGGSGSGSGSGDSPEGALAGKFSVGAGKQVQFSSGNLQATYDGSKYSWGFAANQYDYVGDAAGNTTIGSQTSGAVVDLFGWSTAATTYGISTSTSNGDYSGDFVDWGKAIDNKGTWRTLSKDEWVYLFETRTNASDLYEIGVTVCGKDNCVIIAPDNWDTSANPLQTSYDATAWATAEAAGLVCLPAAGYRNGSDLHDVGDSGSYWSSAASGSNSAYFVIFYSSLISSDYYDSRFYGSSVRLITDVEGASPVEPEPVKEDLLSGKFTVSASKQVQFSKGNLVATIDASGTPTAWKFAANQYDYLGEGGANRTIGTAAGDVDFFGWSTEATKYGISTSKNKADYSGDFVDWGKNIGDGSTWRTLSYDEWRYLFKTRTNASGLYKCGVTVCGKDNCVIIAPDNWDTSANPLQTSYDATAWAIAEAAGLVCLPAAGSRAGSYVDSVGDYGFYWSSTAYDEYYAYYVYFASLSVIPGFVSRDYGCSVRLITESN